VTPAPAPVEPRFDDAEPVESAAAPEVIESPVIAPAVPRVKKKAWGGLGARRERPPVDKPLVPVQEPSPASIGAVYKPTKKAAARAAARAAEAEAFKNAPLTPPRSAPSRDQGYAGFSGNSGGGYGGRGGPEETIASGIAATDYAKPMAPVDDAGLPALLTELTNGMLARAGFPCECDTIPGEYHAVKVTADEDSAGMLIGRGGATAESIEHLVERMASNAAGDRVRMNLDINDYRIRREDSLREHAAEAIADVRAGNGPYHMEPMDARERRVVHLFAETMPDITTYTVIGSGGKHVVIALNDGSQPDEGGSQEGGED
jgi:spoIIIJ-associated protein